MSKEIWKWDSKKSSESTLMVILILVAYPSLNPKDTIRDCHHILLLYSSQLRDVDFIYVSRYTIFPPTYDTGWIRHNSVNLITPDPILNSYHLLFKKINRPIHTPHFLNLWSNKILHSYKSISVNYELILVDLTSRYLLYE